MNRSSQPIGLATDIDEFYKTGREELSDVVRRTALTDLDYKIDRAKKKLVDYYFAIFGSASIVASIIAIQNEEYTISSIFSKIGITAIIAAICFRWGYKVVESDIREVRGLIENYPLLVTRVLNRYKDELSAPTSRETT